MANPSWIRASVYCLRYVPVFLIGIYQRLISPFFRPACRFYPSCSCYARLSFMKYGVMKGGVLSLIRLAKCHPFHPGGFDPP